MSSVSSMGSRVAACVSTGAGWERDKRDKRDKRDREGTKGGRRVHTDTGYSVW